MIIRSSVDVVVGYQCCSATNASRITTWRLSTEATSKERARVKLKNSTGTKVKKLISHPQRLPKVVDGILRKWSPKKTPLVREFFCSKK
jgi:hypothetical protein